VSRLWRALRAAGPEYAAAAVLALSAVLLAASWWRDR
jgi:hypothetical protein